MKKSVIVFLIVFSCNQLFSQESEISLIKQTINNMFLAMKNSDTVLLKSCFTNSVILQTIAVKNEKVEVKNEAIEKFLKSIAGLPKGHADEQISFETIKVDGNLASVWTPYQFFFNGKFSHCGVNSFQLVKTQNSWKIQYIIDTRRKNNCL